MAAGHDWTLAVTAKGRLLSWGDFMSTASSASARAAATNPVPQLVTGLTGLEVRVIACGAHHSLALTADGELYVWGKGQGGVSVWEGRRPTRLGRRLIPTRVPNPSPSDKSDSDDTVNGIVPNGVAAGYYHSALIMNERATSSPGGAAPTAGSATARRRRCRSPPPRRSRACWRVYLGGAHTIFKVGHRALMACGSNLRGQLGSGSSGGDASTPVAVRLGSSQEVAEASTLESDGGGDQISQSADASRGT